VVWSYDRSDGYHYGGGIAFGPSDGMLYVAFGDGGENWNPAGNGQNTGAMKVLMIYLLT